MSGVTLAEIRRELAVEFAFHGHRWWSMTELAQALGHGSGNRWYAVALVLERMAGDGFVERQVSGRVRRFRSFRRIA